MQSRKGIFFGWYVVTSCFVTLFLTTGAGFYTFSVLMIPLENSFQASRTAITAVNSVTALVAGFATPLVGMLLHSWGPRKVIGFGAVITGGAFLLMSTATALWHLYLFAFLLGCGLAATTIIPNQTLVSHWFARRRGTAMGIVMIGTALGGVVFAPLAHDLIEAFGWRSAYLVFGVVIPAVIVPLAIVAVRRSPESIGLRPDGDQHDGIQSGSDAGRGTAEDATGLTVAEAVRTGWFWNLFVARFFMVMGTATIAAHIVPIVVASEYGAIEGRDSALMIGSRAIRDFLIISIVGKLMGGYMAERLSKCLVLALQFVLMVLAAAVLFKLENSFVLYLFVLLYGIGNGGAVVYPLIVAERFGLRAFSKILGIMGIPVTLGAAIGQMGAARIFDATGSYGGVFLGLMLVNGICVVLLSHARQRERATMRDANGMEFGQARREPLP
jgi:sugar phosphate permease